ncbi:glycoside hydrolase family 127 protein [Gracilibacillus alcaliphilus]|uniref:hypothetical protein n=1 Tax=Gracilibacillus alcaliphilus TaxID=1401441 RepID=UPI0019598B98|nr:hypothetical protein [Gracilibacillus alcaliphilus]MBM7678131.1 hypothetical protein [Gracilibacillus alcaliphilus]
MSYFYWNDDTLYYDGVKIGSIMNKPDAAFLYTDSVEELDDGVFIWKRKLRHDQKDWSILPSHEMCFEIAFHPVYQMIPGVTYNGNGWGEGLEPKGLEYKGEAWQFAYHRTAVPGGTFSVNDQYSVGMFGHYEGIDFSCSLQPNEQGTRHKLIWPEQEQPLTYVKRDGYGEPYRHRWPLVTDNETILTAVIVADTVDGSAPAWKKMLQAAWRLNIHPTATTFDTDWIWDVGIAYAKNSLRVEEGKFKGFSIGVHWNDKQEEWEQARKYEIGWCGQNASLANSMIYDYMKTKNKSSLEIGLSTLDSWVEHARLPSGIVYCHFEAVIDGDTTAIQDACNLGTAAQQYFEAYELCQQLGIEKTAYKTLALEIGDFTVSQMTTDGKIGKSWDIHGQPYDREGTVGAFLLTPLITAYQYTKKEKYLDTAIKGYDYYMSGLMETGYSTAGALDTYCIDKESAIPLLETGLALYKLTNDAKYLEQAEYAAWYLATWQWHHKVHYPKNSILHQLDYDTFGGTSVSTQHHHIDAYGLKFVHAWLELGELTGDRMWKERANAVWDNAVIGVSDGNLEILGKKRSAGSQDEGFFQTKWGSEFSVSEWLVAWPTAFRLEVLRHGFRRS